MIIGIIVILTRHLGRVLRARLCLFNVIVIVIVMVGADNFVLVGHSEWMPTETTMKILQASRWQALDILNSTLSPPRILSRNNLGRHTRRAGIDLLSAGRVRI